MSEEVEKTRYEFVFDWRIENFSFNFHGNGEFLKSPEFIADCMNGSKFHLEVFPRGEFNVYSHLLVVLCKHKNGACKSAIAIDGKIEIIGGNAQTLAKKEFKNVLFKQSVVQKFKCETLWDMFKLENRNNNWPKDTITIRFCIVRSNPAECKVRTKIAVDRCSFKWDATNPDSPDWSLKKQMLLSGTIFEIILTAPQEEILIQINRTDEVSQSKFLTCKISLLDMEGFKRYSSNESHLFFSPVPNEWFLPPFIKKSLLTSNLLKSNILENGVFTIHFECSCSNGIESEMMLNSFSTLRNDLSHMFESQKHCDVKLQSENLILPAHKALLSSRSPVFSVMFDHNTLENQTGVVNIEDLDFKTLSHFVEYLYTDTVLEISVEAAINLLMAAEKYQVKSLKEKCSAFLISKLCVENVFDILIISDRVEYNFLKSAALSYIKAHASRILSSPQWKNWFKANFILATEIITMLSAEVANDDNSPEAFEVAI